MGRRGVRIFSIVRNFLSSIVNKEFLIFLFFLIVSGLFWLVITMTETYEREFSVPLRLVNVPKDVVVTSEVDDTIKVAVRDKGYILLAYKYNLTSKPISIDYRHHAQKDEKGTVSTSELQKLIYQQMYKPSRIIGMKPDRLVFYFTRGKSKTVPLRLNGKIVTGQSHYVSKIVFSPERVDVYARKSLLDSIHYAFTENMIISNLTDTVEVPRAHGSFHDGVGGRVGEVARVGLRIDLSHARRKGNLGAALSEQGAVGFERTRIALQVLRVVELCGVQENANDSDIVLSH